MYLPFVLMFLILGLLIFVARRRTTTTKPVFFYGNRIRLMLFGYVLVLLLSVGIYFLIPSSDGIYSEQVDEHIPDLYLYASGELPISDIRTYLKEKKEFAFESDVLNIEAFGFSDELLIRVEKSEELDGVVVASYYQTPTIVEGIDVSADIPPTQFNLSGESLEVFMQDHIDINVTAYKSEFPFIQFLNENGVNDYPGNVIFPQKILHLSVPMGVKVDGAEFLNLFFDE